MDKVFIGTCDMCNEVGPCVGASYFSSQHDDLDLVLCAQGCMHPEDLANWRSLQETEDYAPENVSFVTEEGEDLCE